MNRTPLFLLALLLFAACAMKLTSMRSTARVAKSDNAPRVVGRKKNPENAAEKTKEDEAPAGPPQKIGELRVSDDAGHKTGPFWLEQNFKCNTANANGDILSLYIATDGRIALRLRLRTDKAHLELVTNLSTAPKVQELASGNPGQIVNGDNTLGVLWNRELSVWLGGAELFSFKPSADAETLLKQASGAQLLSTAANLGARRTIALEDIRFDDSFMRDTADGMWKPVAGKWELTAMAFPERSANPFSMRASFTDAEPNEDALHRGRQRPTDYGIGVMLSSSEGTLHIERISGGSPASKAGLAEDDIILEVNGVNAMRNGRAMYALMGRYGGEQDMTLKIYRPGEKTTRTIRLSNEQFQWGVITEGTPIKPVAELRSTGRMQYALATSGEAGWTDYIAEVAVKPLGAGGMGLVVAATSEDDYVLFRWIGGPERGGAVEKHHNKLQLVRVAGARETVLAEAAGGFRPYEFYRMAVDWRGDKVRALVDGNEVLAAQVPGLKRGKIGTYAIKGDPVFFDDVHVCSNRDLLAVAHRPERQLNSIFALEDDMERWANPALEWDRDLKTGWSVHRGRFPGEQTISLNKPRFNALNMRLFVGEDPETGNSPLLTIKDGTATITGEGFAAASREIGKGPFDKIIFRASQNGAEAVFDGTKIEAARDGVNKTGFPLRNDRVAIYGLKNLGDPATVKVTSANTLEYSFDSAPADWKVECGRWGLLNKWICDPRWSWFGGRTKSLAAIWNKNTFSGDISVDAHVALMMMKDQEVTLHERPGDYNVTICGDGVNLDSGYTLIFGGDNNMWTRLYRKGVLVAECIKEEGRVTSDRIRHPDKPQLHQRWFHLKLSKIGHTLSFYRDDVLAFTYNDPEPLPGGRIAFWTMDNGVLVSRVRIAHDGMKPAPFEPRRAALYEDSRVINMFDGEVFTAVEPVTLPAAIRESLSAPAGKFVPATAEAAPPDATPAAPRAEAAALPQAYRVTNGTGGGPFALQWKAGYVDPETRGALRFAYRIAPGAKVDLYLLNVSGEFNPRNNSSGCFRWRMTGNSESNEFAPLCGEVPGVVADGKWRTVQFDLHPGWHALSQRRGFFGRGRYSMRLMIGNVDNGGYLLAGMNGNHAGAEYSISEFQVFSPREFDRDPPSVARIIWPYDRDGDGHSIVLQFHDAGGAGINPESLNVNINEAGIPRELMKFNSVEQSLKIDLLQMNFASLQPGQETRIKLFGFEDRGGNPADGLIQSFTYRPEAALAAGKPGPAPEIDFKIGTANDFTPGRKSLGLDTIQSYNQGAVRLEEFPDVPPWASAAQKKSLRVIAASEGASMGFYLNNISYDLRRWPYLELEYKVPVDSPFNLHFADGGGNTHALLMTDVEDGRDSMSREVSSRFGPPEDFIADGAWRISTVPLFKLFSAKNPQFDSSFIATMSLYDAGWRAARRDTQYLMHRITAIPAARSDALAVSWKSDDIAGLADFAAVIDDNPGTVPADAKQIMPNETIADFCKRAGRELSDGFHYIHVRVKNSAGVWSDTAHRKFCIDNTPPAILKTEPANGAKFGGQTIRIFFGEAHAVEGSTLKISLNGQPLFRREFELDNATNVLTLDALRAGKQFDPGPVTVEIKSAADIAGNVAVQPLTLNFTYDQAQDNTPPVINAMGFVGSSQMRLSREYDQEASFVCDFEEHTGHVHPLRDCRMEWLNSAPQAGGKRALKFTCLQDDGDVQIMLHKNAWMIDNLPILHFDYRADAGFKVDLMVEVLGEWHTIKFLSDGAAVPGGKSIGSVGGVVADGQWHHASADFRMMLDSALPNIDPRIINKAILSAHGADGCRRGSTLTLDNVSLLTPGVFRGYGSNSCHWNASDENGIAGYSYVFDRAADTVPPARINQLTSQGVVQAQGGVWYAHVRACDQSGNWSETKTLRIDFGR